MCYEFLSHQIKSKINIYLYIFNFKLKINAGAGLRRPVKNKIRPLLNIKISNESKYKISQSKIK